MKQKLCCFFLYVLLLQIEVPPVSFEEPLPPLTVSKV